MNSILSKALSLMVAVVVVVVSMVVAVVVSCACFLDGRPHAELGEPVHRCQAALQLRGHADLRVERSEGKSRRLSDAAYTGSPVGSLDGCCAEALAQVYKRRRFVYYVYSFSFSRSRKYTWQRHKDDNFHIIFHTLCGCCIMET